MLNFNFHKNFFKIGITQIYSTYRYFKFIVPIGTINVLENLKMQKFSIKTKLKKNIFQQKTPYLSHIIANRIKNCMKMFAAATMNRSCAQWEASLEHYQYTHYASENFEIK